MSAPFAWLWLACGLLVLIAELLHHTYYLLAVSAALFCGAIAGFALHAGAGAQLIAIAVAALLGAELARRARQRLAAPASDIPPALPGATVEVLRADAHRLRVFYRGAEWDAVCDGPPPSPGERLVIADSQGNTLKLTR